MATDADLLKVEQTFGYTFKNKHLMQDALTSPGVERDNHHGNKLLARVGQAAIEMVICHDPTLMIVTSDGRHRINYNPATNYTLHSLKKRKARIDSFP